MVHVHCLMGGTLNSLTMQKNSGCMCKSMYIGHNVQENGGPMKGIMSSITTSYSLKKNNEKNKKNKKI